MAERLTFPQSGDADDAEHFASMIGQDNLAGFVEEGLDFTVDYGVPEVQVTTGKGYIQTASSTASSSGDTVLKTNHVIQVPAQTVSLAASATNYVYLQPDLSTDDNGNVAAFTSTQPGNALLIGVIDTSANTSELRNREPSGAFRELRLGDDQSFIFGSDDDYFVSYDSVEDKLSIDDSAGNDLVDFNDNLTRFFNDIDLEDSALIDVSAINGGGDKINIDDDIDVTGVSIVYGNNPGIQKLVDMPVDSASAAGTEHSYDLSLDGSSFLQVYAESDGVGGVQNAALDAFVSLDMNGNAASNFGSIEMDGDISGGGIDFNLTEVGSIIGPTNGDTDLNIDTQGDGTHSVTIGDGFNNIDIAVFNEGGEISFPSGGVTVSGASTFSSHVDFSGGWTTGSDATFSTGTDTFINLDSSSATFDDTEYKFDFVDNAGTPADNIVWTRDTNVPLGLKVRNVTTGLNLLTVSDAGDLGVPNGGLTVSGPSTFNDGVSVPVDTFDAEEVDIARGLENDGTGSIQVDEDTDFTFTTQIDFNAGLLTSGIIEAPTADGAVSGLDFTPTGTADDVEWERHTNLAGNAAFSIFNRTANNRPFIVRDAGDVEVRVGDLTDGTTVIYDQTNGWVPIGTLEHNSLTVNAGDGLKGAGAVTLGGSTTMNIEPADFAGAGVEDDGADNIRIASTAAGDGLKGGSGSALAIEPADFAGTFLSDDGADNLTVDVGLGLENDGLGNIRVDEDTDFTFTQQIDFSAGLSSNGAVVMNSNQISGLPEPLNADHAARKEYVDAVAQGLEIKDSVDVATDGQNVDLAATTDPNPIDGYTLANGEFVLLKDQTTASENGLYVANTATDPTTWTRRADMDEDTDAIAGAFTFVEKGTNNGNSSWIVTTDDPITLGTTDIIWAQFANAGEITAGDGLTKTGQTLDIFVSDFAGTFLSADGSNNLTADIGRGLENDGAGNIRVDEDTDFTFTTQIDFNAGATLGSSLEAGGNNVNSVGILNVSEINSNNGANPVNVTQPLEFADDVEAFFGTNSDFAWNYESASNELVLTDSNGIELIRQPKGGSTEFLQGADIGSIEAPEDSYSQLVNAAVTSSLAAGDRVGYTLALDNQAFFAIDGEANGSGGIQNTVASVPNSALEITATAAELNSDNALTLSGHIDFTGGASNSPVLRSPGSGTDSIRMYDDANSNTLMEFNEGGYLDASSSNRMRLPHRSTDPSAGAGDMWYRTDLD